MSVIEQSYGLDVEATVIEEDGRPVAGAAWCDVDDIVSERRVTLPFSDYCDVLAADADSRVAVSRTVMPAGQPWVLRTMARSAPHGLAEVTESTRFKWHGIDLTPPEDELWRGLSSMVRRGIRKAEKEGVKIASAESRDQLREWFLLHLRLRKSKFHLLAQPYEFFLNIWDTFVERGDGFLSLASADGRLIAGTLYLVWKDTCYYKFNASSPDSLLLRPNNLLMWHGMREAKRRGLRLLDLGRTNAAQEGLLTFKRGFGAVEEDLLALTFEKSPAAAWEDPAAEARELLQNISGTLAGPTVPDDITEKAGLLLYRYFT
jgi:CelD/BcsL family acetyltransferase involved in cellulose biosynthesis